MHLKMTNAQITARQEEPNSKTYESYALKNIIIISVIQIETSNIHDPADKRRNVFSKVRRHNKSLCVLIHNILL